MGNYLWPDGNPRIPHVTSPYGMRVHPVTGIHTMHHGIDLTGFEWNHASEAGVVTVAGPNGNAGWEVRIGHDDGNMTRNLHHVKNSLLVKVGDRVQRRQRIGRQGDTGLATGVHDHFETYDQGHRIDPTVFMQKYGAKPEEQDMAGPLFISPNVVTFPNGYTTSLPEPAWTALKARFEHPDARAMDWATQWAVDLSWQAANFMQDRQASATAEAVRKMLEAAGINIPDTADSSVANTVAEIARISAGVTAANPDQ